jgi:hypothetical protein
MNKEFVPYEEALALKELGFNEELCYGFYDEMDNNKPKAGISYGTINRAPLYQQAFRWFLKEYKLFSYVDQMGSSSYCVVIQKDSPEWRNKTISGGCLEEVVDLYSYEEAELACIRKLIEIVKKEK